MCKACLLSNWSVKNILKTRMNFQYKYDTMCILKHFETLFFQKKRTSRCRALFIINVVYMYIQNCSCRNKKLTIFHATDPSIDFISLLALFHNYKGMQPMDHPGHPTSPSQCFKQIMWQNYCRRKVKKNAQNKGILTALHEKSQCIAQLDTFFSHQTRKKP